MEDESLILDPQMDYNQVTGLSSEVREKLFKVKPTTIVSFALLASSSKILNVLHLAGRCETDGRDDTDLDSVSLAARETDF